MCNCYANSASKYLAGLLLAGVALASQCVLAADIELLHSFKNDAIADVPLEQITGIQFDSNNVLHAVIEQSGAMLRFPGGKAEKALDGINAEGSKKKRIKITGFSFLDDESVLLVDSKNSLIHHLALSSGEQLSVYGEKGKKAGMLIAPQDLAYSINRRIYIADAGNNEISVYSPSGIFLYSLGQAEIDPKLRLRKPTNVSVDRMERVYVLQPGRTPTLVVYEPNGKLHTRHSAETLKSALGPKIALSAMAVDENGRMILADTNAGKLIEFDWQSGKRISSFGSQGLGPAQYRGISALALSSSSELAVFDKKNKKLDIYKLSESKTNLDQRAWLPNIGKAEFIAASCSVAYQLRNLNSLCLNAKTKKVTINTRDGETIHELKGNFKKPFRASYNDKNIVILDRSRLFVFDINGNAITEFGSSGKKDGQLGGATDIFLHGDRIYVAEASSSRVQVFSLKGVYLDKLPRQRDKKNPLFGKPAAIAVDANRNIYVADQKKRKILVFSNAFDFLYEIGESINSPGSFKSIADLAIDTDNNLYVLTQTGLKEQTIQVYRGPEKVFEFASYSKANQTGIGRGVTLSVSPTSKTIVSVFDQADPKNPGLVKFNYLQVPPPVSGLEIQGGDEVTELSWQKVPGAYTSEYRIYAANNLSDRFTLVETTKDINAKIEHAAGDSYKYIRISAVSGFGTEGPQSKVRDNIYYLAKELIAEGDFDQAVNVLSADLQRNSLQPRSHKLLGDILKENKEYAEAAVHYAAMREFPGYEISGLNLQVEALYLNKDYSEAMALARDAVKIAKDDIASYINCGRLSLKIGDPVGAFVCLEDGLKIESSNSELLFLMAESHIQLGTTDEGLKLLDKAIANDQKNPELWTRSGDLYLQLKQYKEASDKFTSALELDAENTQAQLGLAKSYMALKDWPNAKSVALTLSGAPETEASGNYLLGLMAIEEGKPAHAIIPLSKASRSDPENAEIWIALADSYAELGKTSESVASLRSAVEADPEYFPALKSLGITLVSNEEFAEAAEILTHAAKLNTKDFDVVLMAAQAMYGSDQYLHAAEYSQKAINLDKDNTDALTLSALIARKRGKIGEAIEHLKTAVDLSKNNYDLHIQLGELYLDNNIYDHAQKILERATIINKASDKAYILMGNMYLTRRLFDKSIAAYELAIKSNASPDNKLLLDTAYAEKKRSLEFSSNAPQLVLEDLKINPVFSAAYKQYTDKPVASVKVRNVSGIEYGNLKISFQVKGYMDFPSSEVIAKLAPNSTQEVSLSATFSNRILDIDEDTGVQVEVKLSFVREGRNDYINLTRPMTIYGKNAMMWSNQNMIGSFVTPKDDSLRNFVRQSVNEFKPKTGPLSENLVTAMTLFSAFSAHGIRYEVDPNNPFSSLKSDQIDYVQFGRETLRLKSGDCDDLSVLFSAALENMGVETAIVDVPGHLMLMFNTNLDKDQIEQVSGQSDLLVIHNDQVWVPLEVTMIGTSFSEAWAEGARKIQKFKEEGSMQIIALHDAWQQFQPVTLKQASYEIRLPVTEKVTPIVQREQQLLLQKNLDRLIAPYKAMLVNNAEDYLARMQIAVIYAKNGLQTLAIAELDELAKSDGNNSAVHNNRGNIYLERGDLLRAREAYEQAERLDPSDGGIKLNLAIVGYMQGEIGYARKKFKQASELNKAILESYTTFSKLLKS